MTNGKFGEQLATAVNVVRDQQRVSLDAIGAALANRGGVSRQYAARLFGAEHHALTGADFSDLLTFLGPALLQEMANAAGVACTVLHHARPVFVSPAHAQVEAQRAGATAMLAAVEAQADGIVTTEETVEIRRTSRAASLAYAAAAAL